MTALHRPPIDQGTPRPGAVTGAVYARTAICLALFGVPALTKVAFAQRTPAARAPLQLEWRANPTCASEGAVLHEVSQILRSASGANGQVVARVAVERIDRAAWHVELVTEVGSLSHVRSFEAESCAAAVDAVALILALAVNPQVAASVSPANTFPSSLAPTSPPLPPPAPIEGPPPAPSASAAPVPPANGPEDSTRAAPKASASSASGFRLRGLTLGASLAADAGDLPSPALGVELAVGWVSGALDFGIAGTWWAPQTATAPPSRTGARFQLLSAEARAAYLWSIQRLALGPLAGVGVERFDATGFGGTVANGRADDVLATLGAGGLLVWRPAPSVAVCVSAESLVPLQRPSFVVLEGASQMSLVHRPSPVLGRALFGAELRFE